MLCRVTEDWSPVLFSTLKDTSYLFTSTYLELHFLEVKYTDLWDFVDDIEPVVLLVCHWIPQQAEIITDMFNHNQAVPKAVQ